MKISIILLAILIFEPILTSDVSMVEDIGMNSVIENDYFTGLYYFRTPCIPGDSLTVEVRAKTGYIQFYYAFYYSQPTDDEILASQFWPFPQYERGMRSSLYSTKVTVTVPDDSYFMALVLELDEPQRLYIETNSSAISLGVGIVLVIIFLPIIIIICIVICILRCCCGICRPKQITSDSIQTPSTAQSMYSVSAQPQYTTQPQPQPPAGYPPNQMPMYVAPSY